MENAETTSPAARRKREGRSSVSNGTKLFSVDGLDGRSQTVRRFRDLVETMTFDLGGADLLSEFQRQLIRRAAALSVMAEAVEADLVRDRPFAIVDYGTVCDRLRRLCETLGIERKSRDVTPTLSQYLSAKSEIAEGGVE
jgi:hypothetical protein